MKRMKIILPSLFLVCFLILIFGNHVVLVHAQNYIYWNGCEMEIRNTIISPQISSTNYNGKNYAGIVINGNQGIITFSVPNDSTKITPDGIYVMITNGDYAADGVMIKSFHSICMPSATKMAYAVDIPENFDYLVDKLYILGGVFNEENVVEAVSPPQLVKVDTLAHTIGLTVSPVGVGIVSGASLSVESGSSHVIMATPDPGYRFINWTEEETEISTTAKYTIETVNRNYHLTANFEKIPEVTKITINPGKTSVQKGKSVRFQVVVEGEGEYDEAVTWSVSSTCPETQIDSKGVLTAGEGETKSILDITATSVMDKSKKAVAHVTVTDEPVTYYEISVESSDVKGGHVTGGGSIAAGESTVIRAVANPGYLFDQWMLKDKKVSSTAVYEITDVMENAIYIAVFTADNTGGNSSNRNISVNGNQSGSGVSGGQSGNSVAGNVYDNVPFTGDYSLHMVAALTIIIVLALSILIWANKWGGIKRYEKKAD